MPSLPIELKMNVETSTGYVKQTINPCEASDVPKYVLAIKWPGARLPFNPFFIRDLTASLSIARRHPVMQLLCQSTKYGKFPDKLVQMHCFDRQKP